MTAALTIQGLKLAFYGVQVLRGVDFACRRALSPA